MGKRSCKPACSLESEIDVVVKQVNLDDLNDLARFAMTTVFAGYYDEVITPDFANKRKDEMKKVLGEKLVKKSKVEAENYRRFAGDQSLSRGRYYSLAFSDSGDDGGTLVQELQNYRRVKYSGIVQIFDTTQPTDRRTLAESGIQVESQPTLLLNFIRTRSRPNPFLHLAGIPREMAVIKVPLRIACRRLRGIVDLREPSTASSLAHQLAEITFQLNERKIPAFPFLEQQESFSALIPSLLEQNVGGTDFTNVIGLWLRHSGICGLVYPSARVDSHVNVKAGRVTSWSGFNYVDYKGGGKPMTDAFIHIASRLPKRIRHCTTEASGEPMFELPHVNVHYEHDGEQNGTWKVEGLRGYHEIGSLLLSIEYMLEEYSSDRSTEIADTLLEWLALHANWSLKKTIANTIFHALLGLEQYKTALHKYIRDTLRDLSKQTTGEKWKRLMGALLDIERACQTSK